VNPAGIAFALGCGLGYAFETTAYSLLKYWLPAGRAMLGGSPYSVPGYYNRRGMVLPFLPLAWLPFQVAAGIYTGLEFMSLNWLCEHWKLGVWRTIALLLSFPALYALVDGTIDPILLAAGLALIDRAPWAALLVLACKPQGTVGLVVWLLLREYGKGWWALGKAVLPTGSFFVLSLAYGPWPLLLRETSGFEWNQAGMALGLLVGVPDVVAGSMQG